MEFLVMFEEIYDTALKSIEDNHNIYIGGKGENRNISVNPYCLEGYDDNSYIEEKKLLGTVLKRINFQLFRNSVILSEYEIEEELIPVFRVTTRKIVFNRFGDLINDLHYSNLLRIVNKNPLILFELRTKKDLKDKKNIKIVKK